MALFRNLCVSFFSSGSWSEDKKAAMGSIQLRADSITTALMAGSKTARYIMSGSPREGVAKSGTERRYVLRPLKAASHSKALAMYRSFLHNYSIREPCGVVFGGFLIREPPNIVEAFMIRHLDGINLQILWRLSGEKIAYLCRLLGTTNLFDAVFCREAQKLMIGARDSPHSMQPSSPHDEIVRRREPDDQEFHIHYSRACSDGSKLSSSSYHPLDQPPYNYIISGEQIVLGYIQNSDGDSDDDSDGDSDDDSVFPHLANGYTNPVEIGVSSIGLSDDEDTKSNEEDDDERMRDVTDSAIRKAFRED
ncbi:hypothetical protein HYC85_030522 [Camellia sinensis]|uniref:Uncharacterized protein n=1 Tax=Camellia sinensis TaxID=4442 RepID=A0A7J7G2M6_CAMSI|nr:hypothetical protein HYC85_030522 [Camellia sinensis]